MNDAIREVIETSTLIVHKEVYVCAKVKTAPELGDHFFVSQDTDEIAVVTRKENIAKLDVVEKSNERSLFEIQFSPDSQDAAGFLAVVSSVLAEQGISISVVSTFSKDYILVGKEDTGKAIQSLKKLGFAIK